MPVPTPHCVADAPVDLGDLADLAFDASAFPLRDLTLPAVLRRQAAVHGERIFLRELATGRGFSYRAMDRWTDRVAAGLAHAGVVPGEHLGVLMENSAEHLALFFAIGKLGAVSVPVNTAARGDLLRYFLHQSDCTQVVVDQGLWGRLAEVLADLPQVRQVIVLREGEAARPSMPPGSPVVLRDLTELTEWGGGGHSPWQGPEVRCQDLLMLAYTSGTTGPSKGSMLTHAAALTYGTGAAQAQGYRSSDVFYVCLPLFHNNALLAACASALVSGASVALARRFSTSRFWADVQACGATVTNLLGAMTTFLWSSPPSDADRAHRLRLVSMAPVPANAAEFESRFGLRVMSNYGLSDFGMATSFTAGDPRDKLGSIGRPREGVAVRIVDDDDFEVPRGTPGEIVVRIEEPWRATLGYYRMPEATLAAHRNQWFHTGDRGVCDAEGYFWFVDRKKDCIRRRGENISAYEVEQVLLRHPQVAQAAVFAVRTDSNDEEVGAVLVAHPGPALDFAALIEFCRQRMSYFMVPRYLQRREALPATTNQKIEKYRLKADFEADIHQAWDREAAGITLTRKGNP